MDKYCVPLSKVICDRIEKGLYENLIREFPDIKVVDVDGYVNDTGREPAIGSIFMVIPQGSIACADWSTINGTLAYHSRFMVGAIEDKYLYYCKQK